MTRLSILLMIVLCGCKSSKLPFEMVAWQFHEADIALAVASIEKAPEYGVNAIFFTNGLYRHTEVFNISDEHFDEAAARLDPYYARMFETGSAHAKPSNHLQQDIIHLGRLCNERGIDFYIWTHELDNIPDRFLVEGRVDMNDPQLYRYLQARYRKLFDILPDAAGIILNFQETEYHLFRPTEVICDEPIGDRMYRIAKLLHEICDERGKTLIVRDFLYEPAHLEAFAQMLPRLPDDIVIMCKNTPHEYQAFYPPDPLLGKVGKKRQLVELDLAWEKSIGREGIYAQTYDIKRYIDLAREHHLYGAVGRVRHDYDDVFEGFQEVNLYAFSSLMHDPSQSVEQVLTQWAEQRFAYAPEAVPYIVRGFERSEYINHHTRFHLGNWFQKIIGEQWGDYNYYFGHPYSRSRSKWTRDPADSLLEYRLYYPDEQIVQELIEEKLDVGRRLDSTIVDLTAAMPYLDAQDRFRMERDLLFMKDAVDLQTQWVIAYFNQRLWIVDPQERYKTQALRALERMEALERSSEVPFGLDPATGRRYHIDEFAAKMRYRMEHRQEAIREDEKILARYKMGDS